MGSQVESSFSSQSTQTVVKEVFNVLTPRIMTLISDALSAQEAARQQAAAAAARLEEQRRQALLIQQQQAAAAAEAARLEEQRRQAAAAAAAAAAAQSDSSNLNSLFGDGKTHYVQFEVPGVFKETYNIA